MKYANLEWRDGQPYSPDFNDIYFSADNGIEETEFVFIQHNQLATRFSQKTNFTIVETGFGSGLNFLVTAKLWLELGSLDKCLTFYSIEKTPFTADDLKQAQQSWPELAEIANELQQQYQVASDGFHCFRFFNGRIKLILMIGDVQSMLPQLSSQVDAWFLDGFAPNLNPQMWQDLVFSEIQRLSHQGTTFSTYTAVGDVRRGLIKAGFNVQKVNGCGKKRHMLWGEFHAVNEVKQSSNQPWYEFTPPRSVEKKVCIVGAGIAGISSAWMLVKRGFKVEIIEAESTLGAQASGNPAAMIMPRLSLDDSAEAEFYNSAYFHALRCLEKIDNLQHCWKKTGCVQLPSSERIKKQIENFPQDKAFVETLNSDKASQLSGLSIKNMAHYFAESVLVFPELLLQKMLADMGDAVNIRYNHSLEILEFNSGEWHLYDDKKQLITKNCNLILATAWQTKRFTQCQNLEMKPVRGQIDVLRANKKSQQQNCPISYGGYLLPMDDDRHIVGASFVIDDYSTDSRVKESQTNINDVNNYFNALFDIKDVLDSRASVRAATPDRVPIVGCMPNEPFYTEQYADLHKGRPASKYAEGACLSGLYVNAGHGARGFMSAFLSAEYLSSMICDESLPVSNRVRYALHPARFLIRSYKKKKHNEK